MAQKKNVFVELIETRAKTLERQMETLEAERQDANEVLTRAQNHHKLKTEHIDKQIERLNAEYQDAQKAIEKLTETLNVDDGAIEPPPKGGPKV